MFLMREKPGYTAQKRLRRKLLRALRLWRRRDYDVRFVEVDGQTRYKKVIFDNVADAIRVCDALESFGPSQHFPRLVGRRANEVMVEFVDGAILRTFDADTISGLSDFYAAVYGRNPRLVAWKQTPLLSQFEDNLSFLSQRGVLDASTHEALREEHASRAPEKVWIGFDYTDPIKSNLVVKGEGRIISAIDIKNLQSEMLIGRGMAKASRRWLSEALIETFFEQLRRKGAPDFQSYFAYIKLSDSVQRIRYKVASESKLISSRKIRYLRKNKLQVTELV